MSTLKKHAGNPLGDLRAEHDHTMLDVAFYETPAYLTLIESGDKTVVVGRRGAGKSALAYGLAKYWKGVPKTRVIEMSLEKPHVIGLAPLVRLFGDSYRLISAACEKFWHYALLMEISLELSTYFKFDKADKDSVLSRHLATWRTLGNEVTLRLCKFLRDALAADAAPAERISDLAEKLELHALDGALRDVLESLDFTCVLLIDRLDEGYEPTDVGVGLLDGIVSATIELHAISPRIRTALFLRDNMFRMIAKQNQDYSRNIEGQVLRLHWAEYHLMNMVCDRLRVVFDIAHQGTVKAWNRCVARELAGREGFKKCLQLTLYRPRDLLVLLNEAFRLAGETNREQIILDDVRAAGKGVSIARLDDLHKEYSALIPGLEFLTGAFTSRKPECNATQAQVIFSGVLSSPAYTTEVQQQFAIFNEPIEAIRALYGIGFIGIHNTQSGNVALCHDGKSPDREMRPDDTLLVHPCYWMALNLARDALSQNEAEEIHDEYEIHVVENTSEQRQRKLNAMISQMGMIPAAQNNQAEFEEWCYRAIVTVFAGALRNIEPCPEDQNATNRMIVGLNLSRTETWTRVLQDYQARQVVFIPVNQQGVPVECFRAAAGALSGPNGRLVFLITRDDSIEMRKDGELAWVRDIYVSRGIVVLKITGKFLCNLLGKLRNPQKRDTIERAANALMDTYSRHYLKGLTPQVKRDARVRSEQRPQPVRISLPPKECFGELDIDVNSSIPTLRLLQRRPGGGIPPKLCDPIELTDQPYRILEAGIMSARLTYIAEKREQARMDGHPDQADECEPPPEKTFDVAWDRDDLANVIHNKKHFSQLSKKQKNAIKEAMSRLRNMVAFPVDDCGLITDADQTNIRRAVIDLRLAKQPVR